MGYSEAIARAAAELAAPLQLEVLDFIGFLKTREKPVQNATLPQKPDEIEAFFRSFSVDISQYRFDREEANAR